MTTFLAIWQFMAPPPPKEVAYTDFFTLVRADPAREPYVDEVSVQGRIITFWVKSPPKGTRTKYVTTGPERMDSVIAELEAEHVAIGFEEGRGDPFGVLTSICGLTGMAASVLAVFLALLARTEIAQTNARLARAEAEIVRLCTERPEE
ncbi:MAG: hypothetical protein ABI193_00805 [Minicystis sp.]